MIASLRGRLIAKDTQTAVVECAGVGYGLAMSVASLARLPAPGHDVFVLVHTHLSQDALRLYGFIDAAERQAFEILIGTSGVGPRLALAILSTLAPTDLADAVARGAKAILTTIPGVGSKKAERLLLELKGRLDGALLEVGAASGGSMRADLLSALANLGFAPVIAERAAKQALEAQPSNTDLPQLLREALRATTARLSS